MASYVWRYGEEKHDPKHTTSPVKHGGGNVMTWECMAASETSSLVFNDDVTADKHSSEVFGQYYLLAEDKTEGKLPKEKAGTEDRCSRGLSEHHQGPNPVSGDVYGVQNSGTKY